MTVLGLDTSNYTTSAAMFGEEGGRNVGKLLDVPEGMLGLRQSDALFQHVKQLPGIFHKLREYGYLKDIDAVCASTRPRAVEDSYMPCFLAGEAMGRVLAEVMDVPFFYCSHQQGHIAAAAWSAGRLDLMDTPHLAWHLSGGTTELLMVEPQESNVKATCIGGTSDISAGQLVDRTGKMLGLNFPAGKALDTLAEEADNDEYFTVKIQDLNFSFSGIENQINKLLQKGEKPENIARYALETIAMTVRRATNAALQKWPGLPVLCSGGVASNRLLRARLAGAVFAAPEYSADNAMGAAILGFRMMQRG